MSPFILCLPMLRFRFKGRNVAGKVGLFPQSYTTSTPPPPGGVSTSSSTSGNPIPTPPDSLSPLAEEPESTSLHDGDAESRIGIAIGEPGSADADAMKATMTDVQKAIEQLGRSDRDGAQSFSFASTRDGDTDRETDGTETDGDGEIGEGWHRNARDKLAEQARKVVEAQAAEEAREAQEAHERMGAPPIDVELSEESEAEDDAAFQHLQHMHFTRDHPHIPEEEEDEALRHSVAIGNRRNNSNETSSAILPRDDLSSPDEETGERTAQANKVSFVSTSSPSRFSRSPIPTDRRSRSPKVHSTPTTPDAINIVAPVPVAPMSLRMIPTSTSPEPVARATPTPSVTRDIPAALPSPASASGVRQHSRQPSQQNSVSSSAGRGSSTLAPDSEAPKKPPSEWTVDEVVEWLKSKGFASDVYDKFIGECYFRTMPRCLTSPSRRARNHRGRPPRA